MSSALFSAWTSQELLSRYCIHDTVIAQDSVSISYLATRLDAGGDQAKSDGGDRSLVLFRTMRNPNLGAAKSPAKKRFLADVLLHMDVLSKPQQQPLYIAKLYEAHDCRFPASAVGVGKKSEKNDAFHFISEFIPGNSLRGLLLTLSSPLSEARAQRYFYHLLTAMHAVHSAGTFVGIGLTLDNLIIDRRTDCLMLEDLGYAIKMESLSMWETVDVKQEEVADVRRCIALLTAMLYGVSKETAPLDLQCKVAQEQLGGVAIFGAAAPLSARALLEIPWVRTGKDVPPTLDPDVLLRQQQQQQFEEQQRKKKQEDEEAEEQQRLNATQKTSAPARVIVRAPVALRAPVDVPLDGSIVLLSPPSGLGASQKNSVAAAFAPAQVFASALPSMNPDSAAHGAEETGAQLSAASFPLSSSSSSSGNGVSQFYLIKPDELKALLNSCANIQLRAQISASVMAREYSASAFAAQQRNEQLSIQPYDIPKQSDERQQPHQQEQTASKEDDQQQSPRKISVGFSGDAAPHQQHQHQQRQQQQQLTALNAIADAGRTTAASSSASSPLYRITLPSSHFTVCSFNFLEERAYVSRAELREPMGWPQRLQKTLDFFTAMLQQHTDLDLFALQEFNARLLQPLVDLLESRGFEIICPHASQQRECVAIAYRTSRFSTVAASPTFFDFRGSSSVAPPGSRAVLAQLFEQRESAHKSSMKHKVLFVSAHLPFENEPHNRRFVLDQIQRLAVSAPNGNFIVAGDFNSVAYQHQIPAALPFPWVDVSADLSATAWSSTGPAKLDYVLMRSPTGQLRPSVLVAPFVVPSDENLLLRHKSATGTVQPGAFCSDHCAVFASFSFDE